MGRSSRGLRCAVLGALLLMPVAASAGPDPAHGAAGHAHAASADVAGHAHQTPTAGADHAHGAPSAPGHTVGDAEVELLDLELIDQHGRAQRFASEVIGDKLIVLTVMYTTCTTVCPVSSAIFAQLQQRLGARLGDEVRLVSLSVDPATDTPQRLGATARKFGAREGWLWLTGEKRAAELVLDGLGAYTTNFRDHPAVVLVGDGRSGQWRRLFGFPGPDQLLAEIERLRAARGLSGAQMQ